MYSESSKPSGTLSWHIIINRTMNTYTFHFDFCETLAKHLIQSFSFIKIFFLPYRSQVANNVSQFAYFSIPFCLWLGFSNGSIAFHCSRSTHPFPSFSVIKIYFFLQNIRKLKYVHVLTILCRRFSQNFLLPSGQQTNSHPSNARSFQSIKIYVFTR